MAKNSIRDYSATNSSNTDIQSIDISEGCSPAGINNAIREVMADLKDVSTGAVALESPAMDSLTVDTTGIVYSGGNVGIANSSPTSKLTVGSSSIAAGTGLFQQIQTAGNNMYVGIGSNNSAYIQANGEFRVATGGYADRVTVDSSGNVGIGTVSPASPTGFGTGGILHLKGSTGNDASIVLEGLSGSGGRQEIGASGGALQFYRGAATGSMTESMRIDSSGRVGIGTTNITSPFVVNTAFNSGYISQFVNTGTGSDPNGVLIQAGVVDSAYILRLTKQDATDVLAVRGSGNVGIGTTSPASLLHLESDTPAITLRDTSAYSAGTGPYIQFQGLDSGSTNRVFGQIYGLSNGSNSGELAFYTRNSGSTAERLRIDSSGNLLAGTTSSYSQGERLAVSYNYLSGTGIVIDSGSGGGAAMRFRTNGSLVGSITTTTSSTAYNTSSDYRLKTAVTYDWDATSRLKQLKPARFEWIADGDDAVPVDGFLAHEVQDIVPEAISGTKDAMMDEEYEVSAATGDIYTPAIEAVLDEDGNEVTPAVAEVIHSTDVEQPEELAEGQQWRETTAAVMGTRSVPDYQGIDQSKLVPLLVKTIQELEARITALEAN